MALRADVQAAVERVTKQLVDDGKLIEAGFAAYLVVAWGIDVMDKMPSDQLGMLRQAFFSGAQHLFGSIMTALEPGQEPTDADLKRMDLIATELERWVATFARDSFPTKGSA